MIKDHFLRAPQGCLRSWCPVDSSGVNLIPLRGGICLRYLPGSNPEGPQAHILAAVRLFTCQRAGLEPVARFQVLLPIAFRTILFPHRPTRGGGILSPVPPLSTARKQLFSKPLAAAGRCRTGKALSAIRRSAHQCADRPRVRCTSAAHGRAAQYHSGFRDKQCPRFPGPVQAPRPLGIALRRDRSAIH